MILQSKSPVSPVTAINLDNLQRSIKKLLSKYFNFILDRIVHRKYYGLLEKNAYKQWDYTEYTGLTYLQLSLL